MRVYHFIKLEHGLDSLRDKRLKISLIDKLNDPFELLALKLLGEYDKELDELMAKLKNFISQKYGILCFSLDWNSPLLWAHYAGNHKGICLGFEISERAKPINVTYINKRYNRKLHKIIEENNVEEMRKILSTKHTDWKYEKEIRLFTELAHKYEDKYYYNFSDSEDVVLKEVIIGCRSQTTREEITQKYGSEDINIFKVKASYSDFTMVKDIEF